MSNENNAEWSELAIDKLPASWKAKFEKGLSLHAETSAYDKALISDYAAAVADQLPSGKTLTAFYKWGSYRFSIQDTAKRANKNASALIPKGK